MTPKIDQKRVQKSIKNGPKKGQKRGQKWGYFGKISHFWIGLQILLGLPAKFMSYSDIFTINDIFLT